MITRERLINAFSWILCASLVTLVIASTTKIKIPSRILGVLPTGETVLPARIEGARASAITAEYGGTVVSVNVNPGAVIKAGDVLAVIANGELSAESERARVRLRFALDRLSSIRGTDPLQARARLEREQVATSERSRSGAIERMQTFSIEESEKAYADAKQRAEELRSLQERSLATRAEFEEAQARAQDELRALNSAREHVSRLKQESEVSDSQLRLIRMQSQLNNSAEGRAAQLEYADAQAAYTMASQRVSKQRVRASYRGTVLQVTIKPGDPVAMGAPLFRVADLTQLVFEAPIGPALAQKILVGNQVSVRIPTEPPTVLDAKISSVAITPDPQSKAYTVRVTVPNPNPKIILVGLEGAIEFKHLDRP